jgi:hypothetical protein
MKAFCIGSTVFSKTLRRDRNIQSSYQMRGTERLVTNPHREKWQGDGKRDQNDDNPLKHFHPPGAGSIGHLAIDTFQCLQFAQDARIPCF